MVGTRPRNVSIGDVNVSAAHASTLKPMMPTSTLIALSKPANPPTSTNAAPMKLCATAPHDCGITPPVRLAIPRPVALVSAAVTANVQSTR